jgi:hypothetical protein
MNGSNSNHINYEAHLNHAVHYNNLEKLKLLLENPECEVDITNALNTAVCENNPEMLELLLTSKQKGNITNALSSATNQPYCRPDIVSLLLNSGREGNINPALSNVVLHKHVQLLKQLLESNLEGDITDALSDAASRSLKYSSPLVHEEMVTLLIQSRRNFNREKVLQVLHDNRGISKKIRNEISAVTDAPQRVVRTGKTIEGNDTHPWKIGGLRFLAARAVAQSAGITLPLRHKSEPDTEPVQSSPKLSPNF